MDRIPAEERRRSHEPPPLMIEIRLPDGRALEVPAGSSVLEVAERIGSGLARAALAGRVDGELVDLRPYARQGVAQLELGTKTNAGEAAAP